MNAKQSGIITLVVTLLIAVTDPSVMAQGNGNGNGNGGGASAAYSIVPFNPPGIESVSSYVGDLNDMGQAAGGFERADGTRQAVHLDLATGEYTSLVGGVIAGADDVNNLNQMVGASDELGANGTLVPPDPPVLLGTFGLSNPSFSSASSVNNFGEISGSSDRRPFIAPLGEDLEELPVPRNTLDGNALDINDSGECVGYVKIQFKGSNVLDGPRYAYLWKNGEAIDLVKQIPKQSGWEYLTWAGSINNAGLIAGFGRFDVSRRGFILIPNSP